LPIGATEDMVIGSLDIERALREGLRAFQPGVLARANRNILYIDEVNLLPDNIVDVILDAAASGWNYVEREGISISHPARFILVGTMNPEEGELRPQLLDRFAMSVSVGTIKDVRKRVEIIKINERFYHNPLEIWKEFEEKQKALMNKILRARERLSRVIIPREILFAVAKMCADLEIDGHRPDITISIVAKTIAAYNEREIVTEEDILLAAKYVLQHRTRRTGTLPPPTQHEIVKAFKRAKKSIKKTLELEKDTSLLERAPPKSIVEGELEEDYILSRKAEKRVSVSPKEPKSAIKKPSKGRIVDRITYAISSFAKKLRLRSLTKHTEKVGMGERPLIESPKAEGIPQPYPTYGKSKSKLETRLIEMFPFFPTGILSPFIPKSGKRKIRIRLGRGVLAGRRALTLSKTSRGHYIKYELPKGSKSDIALIPTIRAAVLRTGARDAKPLKVKPQDIRVKVRAMRVRALLVIVLDVSHSMKRYIRSIARVLEKIYQMSWRMRDKIALIACGGDEAQIIHHPSTNVKIIVNSILKLKLGGRTPLADGLLKAIQVIKLETIRNPGIIPIIILISDGLANVPLRTPLNPFLRKELANEAQADLLSVGFIIRKSHIPLVVINTFDVEEKFSVNGLLAPTQLLKTLSRISGGTYIGIKAVYDRVYRQYLPGYADPDTLSYLLERAIYDAVKKKAKG